MGSWQVGQRRREPAEGLLSAPSAPPACAAEVPARTAAATPLPRGAPCLVPLRQPGASLGLFPLPQPPGTQRAGAPIDSHPLSTAALILTARSSHRLVARLWVTVPEADALHHLPHLRRMHRCRGNGTEPAWNLSAQRADHLRGQGLQMSPVPSALRARLGM